MPQETKNAPEAQQEAIRVLVVEDDKEVRETLVMAFKMRWGESCVDAVETGLEAIHSVGENTYNLVVLDVNLPDVDGFSVLRDIRKSSLVPVIMLTVRAAEAEKVRGLEMGADDYVAKPFSAFELLARASAILRRSALSSDGLRHPPLLLEAGPIRMNPNSAQVFVGGREVKLSPTEFRMLEHLLRNRGRVVSRAELCRALWGVEPQEVEAYLLKLHIQHLRRKLGDSGVNPRLIITVRGFGYRTAS